MMKTFRRQCTQPQPVSPPSSSLSGSQRRLESEASKIRLMRVAHVQIKSSVSKQGHQFYIVDVTRHATSAHVEPSRYELEFRHSTLRHFSSKIRQICSANLPQCTACGDMVDILSRDHCEPSRMQRCLPSRVRYSRLEEFLTVLLRQTVKYAIPNATICIGCEDRVLVVAETFKERYFESCGLI